MTLKDIEETARLIINLTKNSCVGVCGFYTCKIIAELYLLSTITIPKCPSLNNVGTKPIMCSEIVVGDIIMIDKVTFNDAIL